MTSVPDIWWPTALLAIALGSDALLSIRPPTFIRECLQGVGLPRDWWWVLIVVKLLATVGLIAGLRYEGLALASNVGVIAYFVCAAVAHYRARFFGSAFWVNCLGMLTFAVAVLLLP